MGETLKWLADPVNDAVWAMLLCLPRMLIIMQFWPVWADALPAQLLKNTAAMALLIIPAWHFFPVIDLMGVSATSIAWFALTESALGLMIGMMLALPWYAIKATGALIDVLRGATFSALINPASGGEELTLERLGGMVYGLWLVLSPLWLQSIELVYATYLQWPPSLTVQVDPTAYWSLLEPLVTGHLVWALRLFAPVLVLILLVECVLYLISGYASNIQVYSIDAALKCVLALFALLLMSWYAPDENLQLFDQMTQQAIDVWRSLLEPVR